jgi:hypothetical protein
MPFVNIRLIEGRSQQLKHEMSKRVIAAISDELPPVHRLRSPPSYCTNPPGGFPTRLPQQAALLSSVRSSLVLAASLGDRLGIPSRFIMSWVEVGCAPPKDAIAKEDNPSVL